MILNPRHTVLPAVVALCIAAVHASAPDLSPLQETFDRIVRESRAQVGVALIHVESGAQISVNGSQRFPMASVYKLPIAVELLTQASQGKLPLDQLVTLGPSDIRPCCYLSRRHPNGGVTLAPLELLDLAMVESDNTAADAMLKLVGGPPAVQARLRALGFTDIDVSRYEGDINLEMTGVENPPPRDQWTLDLQRRLVADVDRDVLLDARARYRSDPRDSATPIEMARFLQRLEKGELLPPTYTTVLMNLMAHAKTGPARLKGLLPPDTIVAHKTGTTEVVINDVGVITLPADSAIPGHIAIAVFVANGSVATMQRAIARLGGVAFEYFTGRPLPVIEQPKPKPAPKRTTVRRGRPSRSSGR